MVREHLQGVRRNIMADYLTDAGRVAVAPLFKNGNLYDIEFLTHGDALAFVGKFRAKPYDYKVPVSSERLKWRVGWPTTLEQQARGRTLNPIYATIDVPRFAGDLRVGYPRARRPTTVVSVAVEDGSLEGLLRVTYVGTAGDENSVRIEAGAELLSTPCSSWRSRVQRACRSRRRAACDRSQSHGAARILRICW